MTNYDWRVRVRVAGIRDGWHRNAITDTPAFELRSNAQFGVMVGDARTAALIARNMFAGLANHGDDVYVTVSPCDGTGAVESFVFAVDHGRVR